MLKGISENGLILGAFTLITTVLISITFWLTKPIIEQQQRQKILSTLAEVLPEGQWDNDLASDCILVTEPALGNGPHKVYRATLNGKPSALIMESTTPQGYSGDIKFLVSVLGETTIGGVRVLEHKETPGLGDKIELRISDWIRTFSQRTIAETDRPDWAVKKDGGKFEQFTGATITPRAMVTGVKSSVQWAKDNFQQSFQRVNDCQVDEENNND